MFGETAVQRIVTLVLCALEKYAYLLTYLWQPHLPVNANEEATSLHRFSWKMAVKMVCVCVRGVVTALKQVRQPERSQVPGWGSVSLTLTEKHWHSEIEETGQGCTKVGREQTLAAHSITPLYFHCFYSFLAVSFKNLFFIFPAEAHTVTMPLVCVRVCDLNSIN